MAADSAQLPLGDETVSVGCTLQYISGRYGFQAHILPHRRDNRNLKTVSCPSVGIPEELRWEYDQTEGIKSIVNQWYLVCERTALKSTVQSSYMFGVFVGCIVFGWASDRFGRRPTMLVACVIQAVTSILATFSTNYIMFLFLRFLIAFSVSGVFECGFVLGEN